MNKFRGRAIQPPRPDSYHRLARMVRERAAVVEALAAPATPAERQRLTVAINSLMRLTRSMWHRHHGRRPAAAEAQAFGRCLKDDECSPPA